MEYLENDEEKCPPGTCSPIFSWSPLSTRKQLDFSKFKEDEYVSDKKQLYPHSDFSSWMRSCEEEIIEPLKGVVTGTIPKWVNGSLIRNGPGSLKVGDEQFKHVFDSSALLHRFEIQNGEVTYQCRFLQSESYKKNRSANRIVVGEFGTATVPDPCHTIFQRLAAVFNPTVTDNTVVSVYPFGDELYAFTEVPFIHKINSETLVTEGKVNVGDYVSVVHHSAHPHVMQDGSVYNIGLSVRTSGPHYVIACFPKTIDKKTMFERAKIVGEIPVRWRLNPSYMHSFGITENYFIIVEQPLSVSVGALIAGRLKNEPFFNCLKWYQNEYVQINIISRKTGSLSFKFLSETFFYMHIIHQYEIDDHIVLDICIYRDASALDAMYVEAVKNIQRNPDSAKIFRGRPVRFVLPLRPDPKSTDVSKNLIKLKNTTAKAYYLPDGNILVKPEKLCNITCELPRINYESYLGKPYKYFYGICGDLDVQYPCSIVKVDVSTKTVKTWGEENCFAGEPIFVQNPDGQSEDDGVVLAPLVWGQQDPNHVGVLVLDAQSFAEIGRAEFKTPSPVPKCFHGWFLPQSTKQ